MMNQKKQKWVETGYNLIALQGFENVGVEMISRSMNKSKSSFYNYFGDYENYIEKVLSYHITRNKLFVTEILEIINLNPDLIDILLKYKTDIFFYKRLYTRRDKAEFNSVLELSFSNYSKAIEEKWVVYLSLVKNRAFVRKLHLYVAEHFLMIMNKDNYTFDWIEEYLKELTSMLGLLLKDTK